MQSGSFLHLAASTLAQTCAHEAPPSESSSPQPTSTAANTPNVEPRTNRLQIGFITPLCRPRFNPAAAPARKLSLFVSSRLPGLRGNARADTAFHLAVAVFAVFLVACCILAEVTERRGRTCDARRVARARHASVAAAFGLFDVAAVEVLQALHACECARVAARRVRAAVGVGYTPDTEQVRKAIWTFSGTCDAACICRRRCTAVGAGSGCARLIGIGLRRTGINWR